MKQIEEDNCLVTLSFCWINLFNPKAPLAINDQLIQQLNEISEKFSYTIKTYNLLSIALMNSEDFEKACQIFENALIEN